VAASCGNGMDGHASVEEGRFVRAPEVVQPNLGEADQLGDMLEQVGDPYRATESSTSGNRTSDKST